MFSIQGLVRFVFQVIILGAVVCILLYLISISPIPMPWKGWVHLFVEIACGFIAICMLLSLGGWMPPLFKGRDQ